MSASVVMARVRRRGRAEAINSVQVRVGCRVALVSELGMAAADFNELERVVLDLTTELLTTRGVAAALFDEAHRALGSEGTIEVLMLINRWSGLALMLNALNVDVDESARISIPAD